MKVTISEDDKDDELPSWALLTIMLGSLGLLLIFIITIVIYMYMKKKGVQGSSDDKEENLTE